VADTIFNSARAAILGDTAISSSPVDFEADDIKVALLTSTYTIDATDVYYSDLTNEVANGNGYTTGGQALAGKAVTYTGGTATFDATDTTWSTSTITARYAVVYKNSGVGTTSPVLFLYDFGSDKSSSGGDFTIAWNGSGLATLS
jgi:hypothetical protein